MTLRARIEALVEAAPPEATVPVSWLASLLTTEEPVQIAADATADLTVAQVAQTFGKATSTIRTWLARGELPGAYRAHDKEWRVPRSAIATMQQAQQAAHIARKGPATPTRHRAPRLDAWRAHLPATRPT